MDTWVGSPSPPGAPTWRRASESGAAEVGVAVLVASMLIGVALAPAADYTAGRRPVVDAAAPAAVPAALPSLRATPDALVYGHAATVYLQILAAGRLDGDAAADLVVGELPTGRQGDERTESNLLLGRAMWPARAGTEALASRKILEPVQNERDRFGFLGCGDLDGDGRDDLVTVFVRQPGEAAQMVRLGLHWGPETWSGRPNFVSADVVLSVPSKVVPETAAVGDLDGDGAGDLVLVGADGVNILRGRRPWPSSLSLEPPDVRIVPAPVGVRLGDVTGDGRADLWLAVGAAGIDAALLLGRASWPADVDLAVAADVRLGGGSGRLGGAIVPDLSGDGVADLLRIDNGAASLEVYHGGPTVVERLTAGTADWAVTGISDTFDVAALDLTGDGVAELLLDRHAVLVGRAGRGGTIDLAAGGYDAEWPGLGAGPIWSLDVDGQRGNDVLVGDSSGSVPGRRGAGTIAIYLSPLFTPAAGTAVPTASRTPMPTVTPTLTTGTPTPSGGSATAGATEAPGPTATASATAGGGEGGWRVWLPVADGE